MVEVHDQIRDKTGHQVALLDLFQYPTVRSLAGHIEHCAAVAKSGSVAMNRGKMRQELAARQNALRQLRHKTEMSAEDTIELTPDIAIIGYSARFPGAENAGRFWENLRLGVESIRSFSVAELESVGAGSGGPARSRLRPRRRAAGEDLDGFDAGFFGIHARGRAAISGSAAAVVPWSARGRRWSMRGMRRGRSRVRRGCLRGRGRTRI